MVDPKRSSSGVKGSLHPLTAAALSALPPLGYKAPPTLIGFKTIDPSVIALRIKHYNRAYKTLSVHSWNTYVSFGIQDFVCPDEYFSHKAQETIDEGHLRLARYYRKHLENHAKIDGFLMQTIPGVETALAQSHPSFFDMSLNDMDLYLLELKQSEEPRNTFMDVDTANHGSKIPSLLSTEATVQLGTPSESTPRDLNDSSQLSIATAPTTQEDEVLSPVQPAHSLTKTSYTPSETTTAQLNLDADKPRLKKTTFFSHHAKRPTTIKHMVRVETRWAPKDFNELRLSSEKMHRRLAPILSCFNTDHSWMMEWQVDQMDEASEIAPAQLSKYLSIRVVPVAKEQCFYFSFRINATGAQFSQVMKSKVLAIAKRGENMTFDPSAVPASQGELTYVGDILLKDASVTHRGQYLKYLRHEVLPSDAPVFDIKLRHSNPTGSRITILTVRCGKSMSTKLAEHLSTALCGEGTHQEIFISRLALGANQTSKHDHQRIYSVHNEFLDDVSHLLFAVSAAIDTAVNEFFDSGETISRTPRQWAKSLISPDGESLEVDLENGGSHEGRAVLVVPSASLTLAKAELQNYWTRRNPTLSHATKLYTESMESHPDIPKSVFTKNIDTILSKRIKRQTDSTTDDSSSLFSPVSSLTGGGTTAGTSTTTKGSIAWRKPLQETLLSKAKGKQKVQMSSLEINQRKQIAILEAQLALRSGTNSVDSQTSKSAKSKTSRSSSQSGLTAASAHSRLDKFDSSLAEIKAMFKEIMVSKRPTQPSTTGIVPLYEDPLWVQPATDSIPPVGHGMQGVQLFPSVSQDETALALLGTPKKANPLKRRAASTPTKSPSTSNMSLQYNENMGSRGGDTC
jgi:hypothetical protein